LNHEDHEDHEETQSKNENNVEDFEFYEFEWITMAVNPGKECSARFNKTIPCDGEFVKAEGLCLHHAVLFNIWIDLEGFSVYQYKPRGEYNKQKLNNWKRSKFHRWLDGLTVELANRMVLS